MMAALQGLASLDWTALAAKVARTVIRVKSPANHRVKILGYGFVFDGAAHSVAPVRIQIGRIAADGTFTPAIILPNEQELTETETFQTSVGLAATAEPTYSHYLKTLTVHPQLGYECLAPPGQEIIVRGGGMLGFVVNSPERVGVRGYLIFEE